jgi:hypothetical protein
MKKIIARNLNNITCNKVDKMQGTPQTMHFIHMSLKALLIFYSWKNVHNVSFYSKLFLILLKMYWNKLYIKCVLDQNIKRMKNQLCMSTAQIGKSNSQAELAIKVFWDFVHKNKDNRFNSINWMKLLSGFDFHKIIHDIIGVYRLKILIFSWLKWLRIETFWCTA